MEVSLPVSSSSQKEEPRFLPRAVDGATEVERFGAVTARAARAIDIQRPLYPSPRLNSEPANPRSTTRRSTKTPSD